MITRDTFQELALAIGDKARQISAEGCASPLVFLTDVFEPWRVRHHLAYGEIPRLCDFFERRAHATILLKDFCMERSEWVPLADAMLRDKVARIVEGATVALDHDVQHFKKIKLDAVVYAQACALAFSVPLPPPDALCHTSNWAFISRADLEAERQGHATLVAELERVILHQALTTESATAAPCATTVRGPPP